MAKRLSRRRLFGTLAGLPFLNSLARGASAAVQPQARVRLGDPAWPSEASWDQLDRDVGGRLIKVRSPLADCVGGTPDANCEQIFKELKNPYYLGDEVGLTQSLGWVGAWTSEPSVYAVAAKTTQDVVAAVNFARTNNLRLVVKGGGHSYQGTSNAANSLLIWTRHMNAIVLHDAFVGAGCAGNAQPQPAVSIEPGAYWRQAYDAVTTKGGRYVQGGGCMTVGVAGLVLGGGFGSWSKAFGLAGANLLEAEVVTADGEIRIANACSNPDLFWALKGGGGGFGVVTRVTLRTHELPEFLGGVFATIKASSDEAYRRLISKIMEFYAQSALQSALGRAAELRRRAGVLSISMVLQGLDQQEAEATWRPFFDWVSASGQDFTVVSAPRIISEPARRFWDPAFLEQAPGLVISDDRPGAPADNIYLGRRRSARVGRGLARLPIRVAAPVASCGQSARTTGRRAIRGREASGRLAACQQGTRRRNRGRDRHGSGYGDEPGGRRCVRARDQWRWGTARLPGRSRPRAGRSCRAKRG